MRSVTGPPAHNGTVLNPDPSGSYLLCTQCSYFDSTGQDAGEEQEMNLKHRPCTGRAPIMSQLYTHYHIIFMIVLGERYYYPRFTMEQTKKMEPKPVEGTALECLHSP